MAASLNLNRLAYFSAVADAGSFTRAAGQLGMTKAVVSQQVSRLEQELGVTLLTRTTRKVSLTEAGRTLHARCAVIMRESAAAFDELAEGSAEPKGTLRVAASFDYGSSVVAAVAADFTRHFPRCAVELSLSDRLVDLQAVDLTIRIGQLPDSTHQVRRIGTMEQLLVGGAALAAQVARLRGPEELAPLPFVANGALPEPNLWRFSHARRGRRAVRLSSKLRVDATPAAHAAVLAGAGISVLPDYLVESDLEAGRLVRVLPEWRLRSGGIHVLLPSARFRPQKVARFVELIVRAEAARRRHA